MKIAVILGTRPEIIKNAPIINELGRLGSDYFILHTGQHYDHSMDKRFFEDLDLPAPKYNLNVGGLEYRKQVGLMVREIIRILNEEKPGFIIVQGDTNTVLAGALAGNKLGIKVAHHEAGLRSHDLGMLEEMNRIITDNISDFLFAPTEQAYKNLIDEGMDKGKILLSGNTIVDAVLKNIALAGKKTDILKRLELRAGGYVLATAHRAENVDDEPRFRGIINGLDLVSKHLKLPIIYPIHPRAMNNIRKFAIDIPASIRLTEPLGYLEFLQLLNGTKLIVTDSGGLQEEASILEVPCVTVRDNTERPETVTAGNNVLAGTSPDKILKSAVHILCHGKIWPKLYGDGHASQKIIGHLVELTEGNI